MCYFTNQEKKNVISKSTYSVLIPAVATSQSAVIIDYICSSAFFVFCFSEL